MDDQGSMTHSERRQNSRAELSLPTLVEGSGAEGTWTEMVTSLDASLGGVSFPLEHEVSEGCVLRLSLPLPKRLRRYDLSDPSYQVYAAVRHIRRDGDVPRVGVLFLGRNPPSGYSEDPAAFPNIRIRREGGAWEQARAEHLSRGGARVLTALSLSPGEHLEVQELRGDFHSQADVRNVYVGADGIPRVELRFRAPVPERLLGHEDS